MIVNCKQCYSVFRQASNGAEFCPECSQYRQKSISLLFDYLHRYPNQTIEEIAEGCGLPANEVEDYFYNGYLGGASHYIVNKCHLCGHLMPAGTTRRRVCPHCTEKIEEEADITARLEEQGRREAAKPKDVVLKSAAPKAPSADTAARTYGFKRTR